MAHVSYGSPFLNLLVGMVFKDDEGKRIRLDRLRSLTHFINLKNYAGIK